jgi:hypothetical protein
MGPGRSTVVVAIDRAHLNPFREACMVVSMPLESAPPRPGLPVVTSREAADWFPLI